MSVICRAFACHRQETMTQWAHIPPPIHMNKHIILSAAALLAAPVCAIAAETSECAAYMLKSMDLLNEVSTILEKATPATADQCVEELNALKPTVEALALEGDKFNEDDQTAAMQDPEIAKKVQETMARFMGAAMKLAFAAQSAEGEDGAKMEKVLNAMKSIGPNGGDADEDYTEEDDD